MTKKFFQLSILVFLFGVFISCNKDESPFESQSIVNKESSRQDPSNLALDSLITAIDEYNAAFSGENRDVRSYARGYLKIVESSRVSETDKKLIFDGTSVAVNSRTLWNAVILQN